MPNKDGTGPAGKGPMTGLGLGNCGEGGQKVDLSKEEEIKVLERRLEDLKNA